jgi:hypothetical protein
MMRRLLILTLLASFGSGSLAFAEEGLLQSGTRIAGELGRTSGTMPASDSRAMPSNPAARLVPRSSPLRGDALEGQEQPALAHSGLRKRTKILIFVAAGVGFAAAAYTIDHHVVNITPSSLGTRKD